MGNGLRVCERCGFVMSARCCTACALRALGDEGWPVGTYTTSQATDEPLTLEKMRETVRAFKRERDGGWIDDFCSHLAREMAKEEGR